MTFNSNDLIKYFKEETLVGAFFTIEVVKDPHPFIHNNSIPVQPYIPMHHFIIQGRISFSNGDNTKGCIVPIGFTSDASEDTLNLFTVQDIAFRLEKQTLEHITFKKAEMLHEYSWIRKMSFQIPAQGEDVV